MTLVWDEAGTRYFETGVSRGIFFPMTGTGVPWNGLVSVSIDPVGGELESYYFDGLKYMDRILAEEFQATVTSITTPKEFEPCDGVQEPAPGMKTFFNKRDKFNMAWRTEIGNDQDTSLGYKIHIAYNCTVQPSGRAYPTIADTTTPASRSFVITTTPACGRHSYFAFDSRDTDLSALEAQLSAGTLPRCWDLVGLVVSGPVDPYATCPTFSEDFEEYNPGQVLGVSDDSSPVEHPLYGQVNNGLSVVELPAQGDTIVPVDSDAEMVNPGSDAEPLADDSDGTYVTSSPGDIGWTIPIPQIFGVKDGSEVELHIRMSISGGVSDDDPDTIDADAQVFLCADTDGDMPYGGFSDGTDEGMGFALTDVDGNPVDYVIPLNMDAWVGKTYQDVLDLLFGGPSNLCLIGADNNNPGTDPIVVNVYEASIVVLNSSDQDKYLRYYPPLSTTIDAFIDQDIYSGTWPTVGNLVMGYSSQIDFKVFRVMPVVGVDGYTQDLITWDDIDGEASIPGVLRMELDGDDKPVVKWYDGTSTDGGTVLDSFSPIENTWYTAIVDVSDSEVHLVVTRRDVPPAFTVTPSLDNTQTVSITATTHIKNKAGAVANTDSSIAYEVGLDNAFMQAHCGTAIDLSTAQFNYEEGDSAHPYGEVIDGAIHALNGAISVYFPSLPLTSFDRDKTYRFMILFESGDSVSLDLLAYPALTPASWAGDRIWVGDQDDNADDVSPITASMGVHGATYADWNSVPEDYAGFSFEFATADATITLIQMYEV